MSHVWHCNISYVSDDVWNMALCNMFDLSDNVWSICHTVGILQYISPVWQCIEHFARVYKVWNTVTSNMHLVEQHGARAMSLHTKFKHLGKTCLRFLPPPHTVHMLDTLLKLLKMNTSPLFMNSVETSESNRSKSVSPGENPRAA